MKNFSATKYSLQNVTTGRIFEDEGWLLDDPEGGSPSLIRARYTTRQIEPGGDEMGIYRFAQWLPVGRMLKVSCAPVTYKSSKLAAALGLKRSSEEKHQISSRIRTQMVKRERRRIVFGLEPVTGIRVISNRAKVRVRSNLKSNGYIISEEHNVIYYTGTTERRERLESRGIRLGLHILPLPEDSSALSSNIILQQPCSTDR